MRKFLHKHGILLQKTEHEFENLAVFNPAVMQQGNTLHLYYRAVRTGNHSTLGYCRLEGPLTIVDRDEKPIFIPKMACESQGVEDPRITNINGTFYLSYSTFDGINVSGAYATTKDLKTFERQGVITPIFTIDAYEKLISNHFEINYLDKYIAKHLIELKKHEETKKNLLVWDKNIVFFPKKINNKLVFLHRLYPSIQILYFNNPEELTKGFWKKYISNLKSHTVLIPKYRHESGHIGAGCPPIQTNKGWLLIYHAAQRVNSSFIYHASAALLDIKDPSIELSRLKEPLFSPNMPYELKGQVNNVVFPTGTALFGEDLYIYYGAADSRVAVASVNFNALINKLVQLI